ncbi:MAG: LuxR C-terminal-related transcriptional regulator [Deinococcota bacterium]
MAFPILATKVYVPQPRANLVDRPRLLEALDTGLKRKLSLLAAPAGSGKTTLVSAWLATCKEPATWLSLDEDDSDLRRFLSYLANALEQINPTLGQGLLAALESPQTPPTDTLLTGLINDISTLDARFILVLDDYHVIDNQDIDDALCFLIEHQPPQIHLVITTREDPQLPLSRLRVRGEMTEIRMSELRFTRHETDEFLNQVMGLALSASDIATLESRTEGWIASLHLAAISMRAQEDVSQFITSFSGSHHFVLDYLLAEILQHQSAAVQTFLLHTAILKRFCAPLCDSLMARSDSQDTLDYLERAGLLLIPLDNERLWYRYHHLFADALRARLERLNAGYIPELHMRASQWFEQQGSLAEAIHHALDAKAYERAADVMEREWSLVGKQKFQSPANLAWLRALPNTIITQRPILSLSYAWQLLNFGDLDAVAPHLAAAAQGFQTLPNSPKQQAYLASLENAHAFLASARHQPEHTIHHAGRARDYANDNDDYSQGIASSLTGLAQLMLGDLDAAFVRLADSSQRWLRAGNLMFAVSPTFALADIRLAQGRLHDATSCYQTTLQLIKERGQPKIQGTAEFHLGLSEIYREQGKSAEAHHHFQRSLDLGEATASPYWQYRVQLARASVYQSQSDYEAALTYLDAAEQVYYPMPLPDRRPVAALKARVWLLQGDVDKAATWARERDLKVDDDVSFLLEFEHITLARLLMAQDRVEDASQLLSRLLAAAEKGGRMASVLEILVLQALLAHAQDKPLAGLEPLRRALTLAEPEGYVRLFTDEGAAMQQLLKEAHVQGAGSHYVSKLLDFMNGTERQPTMIAQATPQDKLVEPLSGRELEVLQLIAEGLSNQEIAERLSVSLSTIKGHNHNIFGKLLVQRRTEAVAKARALALL